MIKKKGTILRRNERKRNKKRKNKRIVTGVGSHSLRKNTVNKENRSTWSSHILHSSNFAAVP
jgi:hypothetical protein